MLMAEAPSHTPKVILECIAGVDLHRKVMIIDQPVTIAHAAYNPDLAIEALTRDEGYIIARLENGLLVLDGIHCYVPLIVNDEGGSFIVLREKDILRLGNSIWRANRLCFPWPSVWRRCWRSVCWGAWRSSTAVGNMVP